MALRVDHTLALRVVFLLVHAALAKRGACLGVPAARRGSFGLGAAVCGAAQIQQTGSHSGERLAGVHRLPRRARWCAGGRGCLGVLAARRGSVGLGTAELGVARAGEQG